MKSVLYALILFLAIVLLAVLYDSMSESGGTGGGPAGSVVFSTSKDRSITSTSDVMNDGNNSFTIELFYKADDANLDATTTLYSFYGTLPDTTTETITRFELELNAEGKRVLKWYVKTFLLTTYVLPTENLTSWNHIAYVYNSNNENRMYFNGNLIHTEDIPLNINYASPPVVELGFYGSAGYFVGNIANVRFSTKVQYTENFSIPSVPLSATDTATFLQFKSQADLLVDDADLSGSVVKQQGDTTPMTVENVVISF